MHTKGVFALAVLLAVVQGGCATLLKGTTEDVMITSDPSAANVSINDQSEGTTPYVAHVASSKNLEIAISKPGYQTTTINDNTSMRSGYEIWSFLVFVIPMGIDMADGAAWGHDQTMVAAHLEPLSPPPPPAAAVAPPAVVNGATSAPGTAAKPAN